MSDTLIVVYAAGTGGTEDGAAAIDIPDDGTITGVQVAHSFNPNADNTSSTGSLSFIATNQIATNDSRGELVTSRLRYSLVTSGAAQVAHNFFVPMNVDVAGGERIYAHIVASAGIVTDISFIIHLDTRRARTRRSQRRR